MGELFTLAGAVEHSPAVRQWFQEKPDALRGLAHDWFTYARTRGNDIRELLHDGWPVLCVDGVAFFYVNTFTTHANIGFFYGMDLPDPARLLQGTGKRMRHVKVSPVRHLDEAALQRLISASYADVKARLTTL